MEHDHDITDLRQSIAHQSRSIADQDKRLAIVETEMHGLHREMSELKLEIRENTQASRQALEAVSQLKATWRGGWWVIVALQLVMALAVSWGKLAA